MVHQDRYSRKTKFRRIQNAMDWWRSTRMQTSRGALLAYDGNLVQTSSAAGRTVKRYSHHGS